MLNILIPSIAYTIQLLIIVVVAFPLKIKKLQLLYVFPALSIFYFGVVYCSYTGKAWWLPFALETLGAILCILHCNYGNVYRNYVLTWINYQIVNLIYLMLTSIARFLDIGSSNIIALKIDNVLISVFECIILSFITYVVSRFMKKKIKAKYNGDVGIYRILFWLLFLLGSLVGHMRDAKIKDYKDNHTLGTVSDVYIYFFIGLAIILTANIVSYAYNRLEIFRLKKIKKDLQIMLDSNSKQYEEVARSNSSLKTIKEERYFDELCDIDGDVTLIPLTGCVAVDAVFSNYYKQYNENGMILEFHIEQEATKSMSDMDAAVLFDSLFKIAQEYCGKAEGKGFTLLNMKRSGNNAVIKLEFNKNKDDIIELPKRFPILNTSGNKGNELKTMRKIVQLYNGILEAYDMGDEAVISILIYENTGE